MIPNELCDDLLEAQGKPKGDVRLAVCNNCGHLFNRAFDEQLVAYAKGYENPLHHSPLFRTFAEDLVQYLVHRYSLSGKRVVEIGCGDGYLLDLLHKHGVVEGLGFDPSMADRVSPFIKSAAVKIVPEYFGAESLKGEFDFVVCRHVLEHLSDPLSLLKMLRKNIGDNHVPVYFEVPNGEWVLKSTSLWDVIYEHVSYFTAPSIEYLFRESGFTPTRISTHYGEQFLSIEAFPSQDNIVAAPSTHDLPALASDFKMNSESIIGNWNDYLRSVNGCVVVWGAGSKGISFANLFAGLGRPVEAIVDLNPNKHGMNVPGSGTPVIAPEELVALNPDVVLIANRQYEPEIKARLTQMGIHSDIESIVA
ncbi:MAG: class I SAM-dependent methyltransferase [Pseudomonadota bacterium]